MNYFEEGKGMIRPGVTLILTITTCYMVMMAFPMDEWFKTLVVGVVMHWFGGRGAGK